MTPGKRLLVSESFEAAAMVTLEARGYRARGLSDSEALHLSLSKLADRMLQARQTARTRTAAQRAYMVEHTAERWLLVLGALTDRRVLEDGYHAELTQLGYTVEDLLVSSALRQQVLRVHTIDGWPSDED